jgi:hypothetical protein
VAGIYDRNKKYIKTLAPIAAGFIPGVGPAIGAALGAAMGGDREGKGYFKEFDAQGAALGGLSGYGGAKLGQSARGGLGKLFTGSKAAAPGAEGLQRGTAMMNKGNAMIDGVADLPDVTGIGSQYVTPMPAGMPPLMSPDMVPPSRIPREKGSGGFSISGLLKGARDNKDLIAMGGKGIQSMLPDAASDAAMMNAETNRMRLEEEQNQAKMEQERRKRIAELLMPFFQQQFPNYGR